MLRPVTYRTVLAAILMAMPLDGTVAAAAAGTEQALAASGRRLNERLENLFDMLRSFSGDDRHFATDIFDAGLAAGARIDNVRDLRAIRSEMLDPSDREVVQRSLLREVEFTGKQCELTRKGMNLAISSAKNPSLVSAREKIRDELATACALVQSIK